MLGKTELLGFSFVLGSAHPLHPDSQPTLYGGRGTGKSTDAHTSGDKPMTVSERVQVEEKQQAGEKPSTPGACKQRQLRGETFSLAVEWRWLLTTRAAV